MGTIRMNDGSLITIIPDGVQRFGNILSIKLVPENEKTILDYEALFNDVTKTKKIVVVDYMGEDFQIYSEFSILQEIKKQYNAVVGYETDKDENKIPVTGTAICVTLSRLNETEQKFADVKTRITKTEKAVNALLGVEV